MAARSVNLTVEQGTDFISTFTIKNPDGTVLPLTGYTATAKLAKHSSASSTTSFQTSITAATGKVTLTLTNSVTADLAPGRYYYDVVIGKFGGSITRVIEGMVLVTADLLPNGRGIINDITLDTSSLDVTLDQDSALVEGGNQFDATLSETEVANNLRILLTQALTKTILIQQGQTLSLFMTTRLVHLG